MCAVYLTLLFSQSLLSSILPPDWKVGKVVPVFKSGNRDSPLNHRPISWTRVSSKIMEHVIYHHIINFSDSIHFFHYCQITVNMDSEKVILEKHSWPFSLTTYILTLTLTFRLMIIFLDFAKAFDTVPHKRRILKLSLLYLDPDVPAWIASFLTNHSQFVLIDNHCSNRLPVTSGVLQGSVLGPLLFRQRMYHVTFAYSQMTVLFTIQ